MSNKYFVTIDSQFRDDEQWPLETDFAVSFREKPQDGIYPSGVPLDSQSFMPRFTIDRDYFGNFLKVKNGSIINYIYNSSAGSNYFYGFIEPNQSPAEFSIIFTYYDQSPNPPKISLLGNFSRFPYFASTAFELNYMIWYQPDNMDETQSVNIFIQNSQIYFVFDTKSTSGKILRKTVNSNEVSTIFNISTQHTRRYILVFGFNFDGYPISYSTHDWGYHAIYSNYDLLPTQNNGKTIVLSDLAQNIYITANVNPYTLPESIYTTPYWWSTSIQNIANSKLISHNNNEYLICLMHDSNTIENTTRDIIRVYNASTMDILLDFDLVGYSASTCMNIAKSGEGIDDKIYISISADKMHLYYMQIFPGNLIEINQLPDLEVPSFIPCIASDLIYLTNGSFTGLYLAVVGQSTIGCYTYDPQTQTYTQLQQTSKNNCTTAQIFTCGQNRPWAIFTSTNYSQNGYENYYVNPLAQFEILFIITNIYTASICKQTFSQTINVNENFLGLIYDEYVDIWKLTYNIDVDITGLTFRTKTLTNSTNIIPLRRNFNGIDQLLLLGTNINTGIVSIFSNTLTSIQGSINLIGESFNVNSNVMFNSGFYNIFGINVTNDNKILIQATNLYEINTEEYVSKFVIKPSFLNETAIESQHIYKVSENLTQTSSCQAIVSYYDDSQKDINGVIALYNIFLDQDGLKIYDCSNINSVYLLVTFINISFDQRSATDIQLIVKDDIFYVVILYGSNYDCSVWYFARDVLTTAQSSGGNYISEEITYIGNLENGFANPNYQNYIGTMKTNSDLYIIYMNNSQYYDTIRQSFEVGLVIRVYKIENLELVHISNTELFESGIKDFISTSNIIPIYYFNYEQTIIYFHASDTYQNTDRLYVYNFIANTFLNNSNILTPNDIDSYLKKVTLAYSINSITNQYLLFIRPQPISLTNSQDQFNRFIYTCNITNPYNAFKYSVRIPHFNEKGNYSISSQFCDITQKLYLSFNNSPSTSNQNQDDILIYDITNINNYFILTSPPLAVTNASPNDTYVLKVYLVKFESFVFINALTYLFNNIVTYDVTDPSFTSLWSNDIIENLQFNPNFKYFTNLQGIGLSFTHKIQNDGKPLWLNYIGGDSNIIFSENVNSSDINISESNLYLYQTVTWNNKISLYSSFNNLTGAQWSIFNTGKSNVAVLKCNTDTGEFLYSVPIIGTDIDITNSIISDSYDNLYLDLTFKSPNLLVYNPTNQDIGTDQNPLTNALANIPNTSVTSVALISLKEDGLYRWNSKIESKITNLETFSLGVSINPSGENISIIGYSNSYWIEFDTKQQTYIDISQFNFNKPDQYVVWSSLYNSTGTYLASDYIYPFTGAVTIHPIQKCSMDYQIITIPYCYSAIKESSIAAYNRDGTLGTVLNIDSINIPESTVLTYYIEPRIRDSTGKYYSTLNAYSFTGALFEPELFMGTGTNYTNYQVFIKGNQPDSTVTGLNTNFTVRSTQFIPNSQFSASIPDQFIIVLNQTIDTTKIIRYTFEPTLTPNSKYFFSGNMAKSNTTAIIKWTSQTVNEEGNIIMNVFGLDWYGNIVYNDGKTYYIITLINNQITVLTVLSITVDQLTYEFIFTIKGTQLLEQQYFYLSAYNVNATYTLQFYPGSINSSQTYTIELQSLIIPNRPIKTSFLTGVRDLNDFRYIFLEVYNTNEEGIADSQIVNNVYSNDPNRSTKAIFEIPISGVYTQGESNFMILSAGTQPLIRFRPDGSNIRITLKDPYGNVILFDNTTYKTNDTQISADPNVINELITGYNVVDSRLMNMSCSFIFTKLK